MNKAVKYIEKVLFVQVTFTNRITQQSFKNYFFCDSYKDGIKEVFKAMKRQGFDKKWSAKFKVINKYFRLQ